MTSRTPEKTLFVAVALAGAGLLVDGLLGARTHLQVFPALLPLGTLSLAISLVAWARTYLARRADEERRDNDLARQERPDSALFSGAETEPFSIGRTAQQFEKFAVPLVPLLLAAGLAWWVWRLHGRSPDLAGPPREPLFGCAFLVGQAFFLFLLSRYLLGMARAPAHRLLRAPGVAIGLSGLGAAAGALAAAAVEAGLPLADRVAAYALHVVLALLAAENLLFFVVALYAPRGRAASRVPYESRLGALVTDPAAWARDLAQSFDYQFGLKVTESPSYRFLRNAVIPLLIFQALAFYVLSCFVILGPDEEAVLERLGRPRPDRWHLRSGFHLKWPWPFETVRRVPARRILTMRVGFEPDPADIRRDTILWTIPHYQREDTFLTATHAAAGAPASPDATSVGLVSLNLPVEYRITNIFSYVYAHVDPEGLVRDLAYRAVTRELAGRDLVDLLGSRRMDISAPVRGHIQRDADALGLGIEVLFVGVQGVHPPVPVAEAFQSVVGALEAREAAVLEARAYTNSVLPVAAAHADRIRQEAKAAQLRRVELAKAEAQLFERRLATYRAAPVVFASGLYLSALRSALAGTRKYIVDHRQAREVLYFNFQEKPYPDLFDLGPAPVEESEK